MATIEKRRLKFGKPPTVAKFVDGSNLPYSYLQLKIRRRPLVCRAGSSNSIWKAFRISLNRGVGLFLT